jgi:hypothetical protein
MLFCFNDVGAAFKDMKKNEMVGGRFNYRPPLKNFIQHYYIS